MGIPTFSVPKDLDRKLYKRYKPVSKPEFEKLARPLRQLIPPSKPLLPGMGLGEFRGTVYRREARDFLWVIAFSLLLKESAYEQLRGAGITLTCGPAVMEDFKTYEVRKEYQRIAEIKPVKCMAVQCLEFAESRDCPECGVRITKRPKRLFLKERAIPKGEFLFAVEETDQLIANEEFEGTVKALRLKNIAFAPVDLV